MYICCDSVYNYHHLLGADILGMIYEMDITVKPLTSNTPSCRTKSVAQEGVLLARGFRM